MSGNVQKHIDWTRVESIVYSEEHNPKEILGPMITEDGILVQCFFPDKKEVTLKTLQDGKCFTMEMVDEHGYFAVLLPGQEIGDYVYVEGTNEYYDPYIFPSMISVEDEQKFINGIWYDSYEKLGAHPMKINGVDGVYFAVWAPNAQRVSVVGEFNNWDGRVYQMNYLPKSGIFELFVPHVPINSLYKYELKLKVGLTYLKADPYANAAELRPATASVVTELNKFRWKDKAWLRKRKTLQDEKSPIFIYEMHLGSWKRPDDGREFYNYREIAPLLIDYVKEMGYTHVQLMPVMEHPYDGSWGYQITGYYAPTSRYGTPEDFMYFVDALHREGIGVLLDWVPGHFPRDTFGLSSFDGTCLYEHLDPRQGTNPKWGTLIYNYGRPQVRNFLISNAIFWADKFHIDGIRFDAVASMLYLDYGKNEGEWVPNIYGTNENLEAVAFIKQLNKAFKKNYADALLIAEGSAAWSKITDSIEDEGLGFDYKWNMGWLTDFMGYMKDDPYFRGSRHNDLMMSTVYAYSEKYMLSLSHDEVIHGKSTLIQKMPGETHKKFANLRAAFGYFITHPGKILLFMGQDFAQYREWAEDRALDWADLTHEENQKLQEYLKNFIALYKEYPAFYKNDTQEEGFEWINSVDWEKCTISFMRKTNKPEETMVVVCNFSDVAYEAHQIGVLYPGKYKEIMNSDDEKWGGSGYINPRVKMARSTECDERPYSIKIKVAPLSVSVFSYSKTERSIKDNRAAKKVK